MTNSVIITGNIATDIELRQAGNNEVTSINVAVKDDYKSELTHFIRVEVWGKTASNLSNYCSKGSKILVEGSLKVDNFKDKDGNNRTITKVNARRIEYLNTQGQKQGTGGQQSNSYTNAYGGNTNSTRGGNEPNPFDNQADMDSLEEDLPF